MKKIGSWAVYKIASTLSRMPQVERKDVSEGQTKGKVEETTENKGKKKNYKKV